MRTASAFLPDGVDPKALTGELPVADAINNKVLREPWFKHFRPAMIDRYIEVVHKVADNYKDLLDINNTDTLAGEIAHTKRKN